MGSRCDNVEGIIHEEPNIAEEQQGNTAERELETPELHVRTNRVAEWLKEHKFADVNDKKKIYCFGGASYPIHVAAKAGDAAIVSSLLEGRADFKAKNYRGRTAMEVAQYKNHGEVVILLQAAAYPMPSTEPIFIS